MTGRPKTKLIGKSAAAAPPPEEFRQYRESLVWLLQPQRTDKALNIGCGAGRVEHFLSPIVAEIHSVDFAPKMIELARAYLKDCPNCFLYVNDGEHLSMLGDNMFDLAWAELIFIHIPVDAIRAYIAEIHRVLKGGDSRARSRPRSTIATPRAWFADGWNAMKLFHCSGHSPGWSWWIRKNSSIPSWR
jgi:ubiquinone/menaquinone biosynthesis C-methylase UbiE